MWGWYGIVDWSWSNYWGGNNGGSGKRGSGISCITIASIASITKTSKAMSIKTTVSSVSCVVRSWVAFSGDVCQNSSENKELVHNEGFGGLLTCNLNNERKVCVSPC